MGYTVATTSEVFLKINSSADNESVTEISYQVAVVDGLSLTPDYQYIVNPGLSNAAEPAHVFSLRLKLQL